MELPKNPSVLVLLVVTDGMKWLPDTLRGLRAQKYRPIDVLAVDNASKDGSAAMLVEAFGEGRVIKLERRVGFGRALAAALTVASDRAMTADSFLIVHDDAELAPGCVEAMIDTLGRDRVGIVGAKLLEWEDPAMLQDVGQTTDRYGRGVPRVDRGELDQGQHEGIQEVLYATSAVMMIAREVVERVGFFDLRYVVMREDLDLCWRARIAGYHTVIDPNAIARHASATARAARVTDAAKRARYYAERNMISSLIKNYGPARLLLTIPVTFVISLLNVLLYVVTGRRDAALQTLEALQWNIAHLPSTLRARVKAQRSRKESDHEITALMHHGATRIRAQFEKAVERVVGDIDEGTEDELDKPPPSLIERLRRHPTATTVLVAGIIGIAGARTLFFSGQMAGADFGAFPQHSRGFFAAFFSGWRGAGAGGAAPATPGMFVLGLLSILCFGSTWLAQRVLVLGLPVVGAITMFRLARAIGLQHAGRRAAAIAFLVSPLVLGSLGAGRLSDLVLLAAAPGLVLIALRAAGVIEGTWRSTAAGITVLSLASSLSPWALPFFAGAILVVTLVSRERRIAIVRGFTILAGALVLLLPWSVELFKAGSPIGGGGADRLTTMRTLLGMTPGPVHPIPEVLSYGAALVAIAAVIVARTEHRRVARVLGLLGSVGLGLGWAVARGVPWIAPRSALPLVVTAVAAAALAGIGFDAVGPALSSRQIGLPHIAAAIAGALLFVQIGAGAVWVMSGRHPGIDHATELDPSYLAAEASTFGAFRIAWVSGTARVPTIALTGPEGLTMTEFLARPAGSGADALRRVGDAIASGQTETGGRMLATFGVRYVIIRPEAAADIAAAFARQVDLGHSQPFGGATIYQNQIGLPVAAVIESSAWRSAPSIDAAGQADISPRAGKGFAMRDPQSYAGTGTKRGTTLLFGDDYSPAWRARAKNKDIQPDLSFGWATRFTVPAATAVTITWHGQQWHRLALLFELLVGLVYFGRWSRRRARDRGER